MDYILQLLIFVSIYSIVALGLNLVVGNTGLLSMASGALFGIGSYSVAIFVTKFQFNFFAALGIAVIIAVAVALLVGIVFSRFRDDYYMLATVGFTYVVNNIFINWESVTKGPFGITGVIRPSIMGHVFYDKIEFFGVILVFTLFAYFVSVFISKSSFGRALKAIREDENTLSVFGYRPYTYKLIIFSISAGLIAIAGGFFASYIGFIDPSNSTINTSVIMISIVIVGGLASVRGSIVGAAVILLLPELLRFVGFSPDISAELRQTLYGIVLVALMTYRPEGIMGEYKI